ncbi:hypothetical protein LIER_06140 [Lithospermum erythrorhizon]|uniref:Uncharacterized protein n=1 Tax=Lithospermum erythrorhizon TaxID=34254 RepID=A0AAV3P4Y5_LITER
MSSRMLSASVPPVNPGAANQELRLKRKNKGEVNTMTKVEQDNSPKYTSQLIELIRKFADVFAWGTEDMPRVDLALALHLLHVDPLFVPAKQRKRTFSEEKNLVIREEVASL